MSEFEPEEYIRVVAPATLQEGYTFDVLVDDEPFTVLVPKGGVKEGQEFSVPFRPVSRAPYYEDTETVEPNKGEDDDDKDDMTRPVQSGSSDEDEERDEFDILGAPYGRFRTGLCSCCDVLTQASFWMGFFCTPVLLAQLLTRMRLAWNGNPGSPEETSLAFNRIVLSFLIAMAAFKIPVVGGFFLFAYFLVIVVYVGGNLRRFMRKKYKIKSGMLPEKLEDGVCMFFCSCCAAIQMARHTHNDKEYPGYGCTTTGLEHEAPDVEEGLPSVLSEPQDNNDDHEKDRDEMSSTAADWQQRRSL